MQFLNPTVLIGLVAASIPLILHLINLKRNKQVEFSSNKFLEELKKSNIRNVRIKNLLLLILRTLLIISLVLAFARPTIDNGISLTVQDQPTSTIIVIDNSFSMEIPTQKGDLLSVAKNKAKELIQSLPSQSEVAILSAESKLQTDFTTDKIQLFKEIDAIGLFGNQLTLDITSDLAEKTFENASFANKNIFLLSDSQVENNAIVSENSIYSYDFSNLLPQEITNISIDSVRPVNQILIPGGKLSLEIFITNHSEKAHVGILNIADKSGIISNLDYTLNPSESTILNSEVNVSQTGLLELEFTIDSDMLSRDNTYYLSISTPPFPKMAIFGNSESTFYLKNLFNSVSPNRVDVFSKNELNAIDLSKYEQIVCATDDYDESSLNAIKRYIEANGKVILFPPTDTSDRYIEFLSSIGFASPTWAFVNDQSSNIYIDDNHPALDGIYREDNGSIGQLSVSQLLSVDNGETFVRVDGYPLITVLSNGPDRSKIAFVSVSSDLTYSDFPVSAVFAPYLYRTALYLSSIYPEAISYYDGANVDIQVPAKYNLLNFLSSDDSSIPVAVSNVGSFSYLDIGVVENTGNYLINDDQNKTVQSFSINHNPKESITKYQEDDYEGYIYLDDDDNLNEVLSGEAQQSEIWQLFIILSILLAISELLISNTKNK